MVLRIKDEVSIFENVLKYENAVTELLCNFMRYRLFRDEFLSLIGVEDKYHSNVLYHHFYTQVIPEGMNGIPDLWIENEDLTIFVEIKTTPWCCLTYYQRNEYLSYLENKCKKQVCLYILIAPEHYQYKQQWKETVKSAKNCKFISWTNIYNHLRDLDLAEVSGIFREFLLYLRSNMMIPDLSLTPGECKMLFNKETPFALEKLFKTINDIEKTLKDDYSIRSPYKPFNEIGFYVINKKGIESLWFGLWFSAWKEFGSPLSFGVHKNWEEATVEFKKEYSGQYKEREDYLIVSIGKEVLKDNKSSGENIIDTLIKALKCVMTFNLKPKKKIPDIVLTPWECEMLFNKETASALEKIYTIISVMENEIKRADYSIIRSYKPLNEIGFYVGPQKGIYSLWFGLWFPAWKELGAPLSFGIDKNWNDKATAAFMEKYKGEYEEEGLDGYLIVPIPEKVLRDDKDDKSSVGEIIDTVKKALACVMPKF